MRLFQLNPITRKRLRRFREMRRAHWAFWALVALYGISLGAELLCNSVPLYVRFQKRSYFPVFKFYPDDVFTGSGRFTRPDYKAIAASPAFRDAPGNRMVFPLIPYGPYEVMEPNRIEVPDTVTLRLAPEPRVAAVSVGPDATILQSVGVNHFLGKPDTRVRGSALADWWTVPDALTDALAARFENRKAAAFEAVLRGADGTRLTASVPVFEPRPTAPPYVRITLRDIEGARQDAATAVVFGRNLDIVAGSSDTWNALPDATRETLVEDVQHRFAGPVTTRTVTIGDESWRARFDREEVRFPFRPVKGHWLGLDGAGRDVLARVLYGLRTSMTFGLILVACSLCIGTIVGSVQGFFGGLLDITAQRLIEIWSALPFLYIMILMGSVYGRSFVLLIFCYGLFNWIGISYYMRAEMLRLRRQPFVEAARCLGLPPRKIVFRHILPNALVPLITFFPFSLVGAVGALAALDYLGFGLPPPTPSWGELLQQAQEARWAWWLILYPSLALFTVMLLGVFIGEGVRNAFDPRRYSRME